MSKRVLSHSFVLIIGVVLATVLQPLSYLSAVAQPGSAASLVQQTTQPRCRAFPETGNQVCGRFLEYWEKNGGLAQQGLPLSKEFVEVSDLNGLPYTVQYFERAVFEKHPENKAPFDVLLSQLGTFQYKRKYLGGETDPGGQPPLPGPIPTLAPAVGP